MHAAYLQLVGLPTFQARHFHVFSGMIVALILIVDHMFFGQFCSQKYSHSFGYLRIFYVTNLFFLLDATSRVIICSASDSESDKHQPIIALVTVPRHSKMCAMRYYWLCLSDSLSDAEQITSRLVVPLGLR
jgi:hypothetical protein